MLDKLPQIDGSMDVSVKMASMALNTLKDICNTQAVEETKREGIRASRDVKIETIRAKKEVLIKYLELSFAERNKALDIYFHTLDQSLNSGNQQAILLSLNAIVATLSTSPLAAYKEVDRALLDDDVKCIEI